MLRSLAKIVISKFGLKEIEIENNSLIKKEDLKKLLAPIYGKNLFFLEKQGDLKFVSNNQLYVENHIEFAKTFQVGSKKIKHIKKIYFDLEKKIGVTEFIVTNIMIYKKDNKINSNETYIVKNIQNLRSHIREIID